MELNSLFITMQDQFQQNVFSAFKDWWRLFSFHFFWSTVTAFYLTVFILLVLTIMFTVCSRHKCYEYWKLMKSHPLLSFCIFKSLLLTYQEFARIWFRKIRCLINNFIHNGVWSQYLTNVYDVDYLEKNKNLQLDPVKQMIMESTDFFRKK